MMMMMELESMELPILYEDNHLIVVNKPAGIFSQPNISISTGEVNLQKNNNGKKKNQMNAEKSVLEIVQRQLEKRDNKPKQFLRLNHRLDKPVSGLVLLSKTSKATARINQMFASHQMKKFYLGVVCGIYAFNAKELHGQIFHQSKHPEVQNDLPIKMKEIETDFKLLQQFKDESGGNLSLLQIHLHTGRRHQIRSQLSMLGFPLFNDYKYQASFPLGKSTFPNSSIALHAHRLMFTHPVSDRFIDITCPVPDYWNKCFSGISFGTCEQGNLD